MRRKTILVLGLMSLAMVVLVAAGCGGGSKSTSATTEATTTEETTTEEATTEETTTEEATTEATTTAESGLGDIASAENCKELSELGQKFAAALSGAASGTDLKKTAELLKEFAAKTPSDIRADFEVYADFVSKVAAVSGGIKPGQTPTAEQLAALSKLGTEIDQAKLTAAAQHIAAWIPQNCHA